MTPPNHETVQKMQMVSLEKRYPKPEMLQQGRRAKRRQVPPRNAPLTDRAGRYHKKEKQINRRRAA